MKKSEVVCILLCALAALCIASRVFAHTDGQMTYPSDCCGGHDCAPAILETVEGKEISTSIFGIYEVTKDAKERASQDIRNHVCVRGGKVICVFRPTIAGAYIYGQIKESSDGMSLAPVRRGKRHSRH